VGSLVILEEATTVPPSTSLVLARLWRPPLPRPVVVNGGTAICRVVPDKLYVGVLVDVRVGMEFPGNQVVQLFSIRSVRKSQACYSGIDAVACARNWRRVWLGVLGLPLSCDE
jgi:transposase